MERPRVTLIVGKGGVGRTTVAQGYALAASMRGEKTAYVELDVSGKKQRQRRAEGNSPLLHWITLDGGSAIETVATPLFGSQRIARSMLGNFAIQRLLDVIPSIREYALLATAIELTKQFHNVVIDMAATGHGAAWLSVAGRLARLVPPGRTRDQALQVQAVLRDPQQTRFVAVALTDTLVLSETRELRASLVAELGRDIDELVFNRTEAALIDAKNVAEDLADSDSIAAPQAKQLVRWLEHREWARQHASNDAVGMSTTWIEQYPGTPSPMEIAGIVSRIGQ